MKPNDPIDFDSPLGISKKEWTKVLGVNLALLLLVYAIALVCTLCGSDLFLLNFHSDDLQRIEDTLRNWNIFPIVQIGLTTIEETMVACYVAKAKPKWWFVLSYFAVCVLTNVILTATIGYVQPILSNAIMASFWVFSIFALNRFSPREKWFVYLFRLLISVAVMFILNGGIALFRNGYAKMWKTDYPNSVRFAINIEYYLALSLSLGFMTMAIRWKKGGNEECLTGLNVSGSSLNTTNSSPKNSKIAKTNLSPKYRKRLRLLKAKVIAIQTTAP